MTTTHHKFSPSSLDRLALCPGSARAASGMPEHTNEAAAEGTMLHAVMAGSFDAPKFEELTTEQQDLITGAREYAKLHCTDFELVEIEKHMTLVDDDFTVLTAGTADVVVHQKDVVKIIDWKFGRVWVSPTSLQMKAYAAMAMQASSKPCEVHVYQPRAGGGKPILHADMDMLRDEIRTVVRQCNKPDAMFCAGDHCTYCPIKLTCTVSRSSQAWFEGGYDAAQKQLATMNHDLLTDPVLLGIMADKAAIIKKCCDEVLARNKQATLEGLPTGYKIIERKGRKTIKDAEETYNRLQSVMSQAEFIRLLSVPIAALTEAVVSKLRTVDTDLTAKEATERMFAMLDDVVTEGNPTSVCVKDKVKKGK